MSTFERELSTPTEIHRATGLGLTTCWRYLQGYARPSKLARARLAEAGVQILFDQIPRRPDPSEQKRRRKRRR